MNCKLTLGEKLKDLRTAAGLSLVELEEATGISKSALGSYESDDTKKEITIAPLITLAKYYGVTTDYLLGMTDNKEQHLFPVDELGLDDATVKILKSGDLNVRLICEMIKNPAFANFMSDMEIYVDNLAYNSPIKVATHSNTMDEVLEKLNITSLKDFEDDKKTEIFHRNFN